MGRGHQHSKGVSNRMAKETDKSATHREDELLSASEVGRRIGKSHTAIRRWMDDGLLPYVRMPSGIRMVRSSEVNKLLGGSAITARV